MPRRKLGILTICADSSLGRIPASAVLIVGASGDRSAHALPESRRGILAIDAEGVVLDERSNGAAALRLDRYNFVAPLKEARAPETNPRLTSKSSTAPRAKLFPV